MVQMKDKEQNAKLKQLKKEQKEKKKEMKKEINELKGEKKDGKFTSILLFLGLILAFFLFLGVMIKTDVGGIGTTLTPMLQDVNGLNKILPEDTTVSDASAIKKDNGQTKKKNNKKNKKDNSANKQTTPTPAESLAPTQSPIPSSDSSKSEEELKDYADTYSSMEPEKAAAVLENMTGDFHLVAKILQTMKAKDRAAIMDNMDPYVAAKLTVIMNNDLESKTSR